MKKQFKKHNRIIIIGDPGRGKSVLALNLSKKLGIKHYSADDYFWKKKFSQMEDRQVSIKNISKVYETEEWIVEGTPRRLMELGLDKADVIVYLKYKNILSQWWSLFKRYVTKKDASLKETLFLMKNVFYTRYNLGSKKGKITHREVLRPYQNKVIELHSFREIDNFINSL